ncbi:MAG: nitroreductase family protein [Bacillota bacterium]|jgi:predicted oxidoreductase (fatty acid repression mutant protein)
MTKDFYSAIKGRRSYYALGKEIDLSQKQLEQLVETAVFYTPSAFNSRSPRVVLLFEKHHDKLWEIVLETLRPLVPADKFAGTEKRIASFAAGYATILFFEDLAVIEKLQKQLPTYKEQFSPWSLQGNGMLQFVVWTALENEGLGASLQHYNPLIDDAVKKEWQLPQSWQLLAQMPFGQPLAEPEEKVFMPPTDRFKIFV